MLTPEQETWLEHLDDTNSVEIFPYDPDACEKFERIKKLLQSILGVETTVLHKGASSLGISGQKEIDIYIPVPVENFDALLVPLEQVFGKPRSHYPLERVCFVSTIDDTKVEIFVVNSESESWKNSSRFDDHIRENKEALEAYRILKEEARGLSTQAYYRKKIEFINDILSKVS